ncbi:MAG: hypothetical protein ABI273_12620 [Lacunisphaera sp.]
MKVSTLTKKLAVAGSGTFFVSFFALSAHARPGPQFWAQQTADAKARAEAPAVAPDSNGITCPACRTTDVRTSNRVYLPDWGDDVGPTVGQNHTCSPCGSVINTINGATKGVAATSSAQKT